MLRDLLVEIGIDVDSSPLKKLNAEIDALVRRLRKLDDDPIEDLNKEFAEMNRSVQEVNNGLKGTDRRLGRLGNTVDRMNVNRIADGFSDASDEAKELEHSTRNSADAVDDLSDNAKDARRNVSKLNGTVKKTDRNTESLAGVFNSIQRTMKSMTKEVDKLTKETHRLDRELDNSYVAATLLGNEFRRMDISHASKDAGRLHENLDRSRRSSRDLNEQMRRFRNSTHDIDSDTTRIPKTFNKISSKPLKMVSKLLDGIGGVSASIAGSWGKFAIAIPLAIPFLAAAANAVANLGPMIGAIGGGLLGGVGALGTAGIGGFAAMLPIIGNISDAFDEDKKSFNALELESKAYFKSLQDGYKKLLKITEEPALGAFNEAMKIGKRLMEDLQPMFVKTTEAVEGLMIGLSKSLDSKQVKDFFSYLNSDAAPMLTSVGKSVGYLLLGFGNLIASLKPLSDWVAQGLEKMTKGFADWAYALKDTAGFQKFVDYTKENLPKIGKIFGYLIVGLTLFFAAFGGSASDMMDGLVTMMADFKQWAGELSNSDGFNGFLDYVKEMTPKIFDFIGNIVELGMIIIPTLADIGGSLLDITNSFLEFANANPELMTWLTGAAVAVGVFATAMAGLSSLMIPIATTLFTLFNGARGTKRWFGNRKQEGPRKGLLGEIGGSMKQSLGGKPDVKHIPGGLKNVTSINSVPVDKIPPKQLKKYMNKFPDSFKDLYIDPDYLEKGKGPNSKKTPLSNMMNKFKKEKPLTEKELAHVKGLREFMGPGLKPMSDRELLRKQSQFRVDSELGRLDTTGGKIKRIQEPEAMKQQKKGVLGKLSSLFGKDKGSGIIDSGLEGPCKKSLFGKLNKLGKFNGGGLGLIFGGASIANSVSNGDLSGAGNTASSMAGSVGGGWAGAATGAAIGSIVPGIGTAIGGVVGGLVGSIGGGMLGSKLYEGIQSFDWSGLKTKASEAAQKVSESWNTLKTNTSEAFNSMKSKASATWNSFKSDISSKTASIVSSVKTSFESMKNGISEKLSAAKTKASETWTNLKTSLSTLSASAKSGVMTAFEGMKSGLSSIWSGIKSTASTAWSGIASSISSAVTGAVSTAKTALNGLKTTISQGASGAWSGIKQGVSKVKGWVMGSHATGLGSVPFDGYTAELHKNEAILTANQANALRSLGMLKGNGASPQLAMPTAEAAGYSPLSVDPATTSTTSTTNNNGSIRASVTIHVDGSKAPEQVAVNIKDQLEGWFGSLGGVFPAALEG
ncbi:hypothetical protein ACPA0F_07915 [Solibacillus silvestris]